MNVTFLGGMFPKEYEDEIYKKSINHMQTAANVMQWRFVDGIESAFNQNLNIITFPFVGAFPHRYRDSVIRSKRFSHHQGCEDYMVGFCNITIIKHLNICHKMKSTIKEWVKHLNKNETNILIAYSCNMGTALSYAKCCYPELKTLLIVPDLPQFTSLGSQNLFLNLYRKIKTNEFYRTVRNNKIDKYIFLTHYMADELGVKSTDYDVVEAIADKSLICKYSPFPKNGNTITILYTGTLSIKYGILELIQEFKLIKDERYRLIICGGGNGSDKVQSECLSDKRIQFLGLVSQEEAHRIRCNADILVNPRRNTDAYTKYSFPSKIMEYLLTGKPVICYRLDGIPKEYDNVLIYAEEREGGLCKAIEEVSIMDKDKKKDLYNRTMSLIAQKTPEKQCEKIRKLLVE